MGHHDRSSLICWRQRLSVASVEGRVGHDLVNHPRTLCEHLHSRAENTIAKPASEMPVFVRRFQDRVGNRMTIKPGTDGTFPVFRLPPFFAKSWVIIVHTFP